MWILRYLEMVLFIERRLGEQGGGEKKNGKRGGQHQSIALAATIELLFNPGKFHVMYQAEITNIAR